MPNVLVTGAARRLGREIALLLATAGYGVAIHYRGSASEAEATLAECRERSGLATTLQADLSVEAEASTLVDRAVAALGTLDFVVNSASTFEHDDARDFGFVALDRHMHANAGAPILLARALHAHLVARGAQGAVVNLLDQKLWNQNPDFFSYTLSKAALEAANTMLALALAPTVRVVGVAPGLTLTSHMLDAARFAELHTLSPLGRSSTAADVAAAVRFALENSSMTGTTILVDGGQHLMKFERDFSLM